MRRGVACLVIWLLLSAAACTESEAQECGWCGMQDAPDSLSWSTRIAPTAEPGDRLVVEGTVYQEDGVTPAEGVLVYVYHTNAAGVYPKKGDETGNAALHGYLRGWMKTGSGGRYRFETIRPAPYETHGGEPAHVHYTIQAPGRTEYWLNAAWFSDDPRVTPETLAPLQRTGGFSNVMEVSRSASGVWQGRRDIILESFD